MKFIRFFVGRVILLLDFLTRPKPVSRSKKQQDEVNEMTSTMSLYQFKACPFCVKVRRHMRKNSLHIELRDAKNNHSIKEELVNEGGKHKVPCLRIEGKDNSVRWLYSSDDICSFLDLELISLNL